MHKAVLLQLAVTSIAAIVAGALFGPRGLVSAIWGGLAYILPSIFFAWRLSAASWRGESVKVTAFMAGEFVKLLSTIGLLASATVLYKELHWGAFLIGLALAVKANLFAFLVKTRT